MVLVVALPLMFLGSAAGLGVGSPDIACSFVSDGVSTVEHSRVGECCHEKGVM